MRLTGYTIRFIAIFLFVAAATAAGVWYFQDEVRAKSFYYKYGGSDLVPALADGSLEMGRDTVWLELGDTLVICSRFNRHNVSESRFEQQLPDGQLQSDIHLEDLSSRARRVITKAPHMGVRSIRSLESGLLEVEVNKNMRLIWYADSTTPPPGYGDLEAFDAHWYLLRTK